MNTLTPTLRLRAVHDRNLVCRLFHRLHLPGFETRRTDHERRAALDAGAQIRLGGARQREVHGDLGAVQSLVTIVGQGNAECVGPDELRRIPSEQRVVRLGDRTREDEILGVGDATQDGPTHAARSTEHSYLEQRQAPIRSKNCFTPSNHERARGLCREASF